MDLFKKMIRCLDCGKYFNYKNDHKSEIFICSGYKNYGNDFCPRRIIYLKDLKYLIENHCKINNKKFEWNRRGMEELIQEITVDANGRVEVVFRDGKISMYDGYSIVF